jgi:uncharacterized protein
MKREIALNILEKHKKELQERYGITKLGIFGSVIREKAVDESDIDIVVAMSPDLFKKVSLKEELETILGTNVDLVRYWPRMNHYLKRHIDKEACYV